VQYVVRLEFFEPLPPPFEQSIWWAKCDMIATVGFERLDLFRTGRDQDGKRKYLQPKVVSTDAERVRAGVLAALGIFRCFSAHSAYLELDRLRGIRPLSLKTTPVAGPAKAITSPAGFLVTRRLREPRRKSGKHAICIFSTRTAI
jgi:hypothetical protein